MKDGHQVVIVTHGESACFCFLPDPSSNGCICPDEFKDWIEGYGIEHRQAGGDPAALMKLSVEHTVSVPAAYTPASLANVACSSDVLAWLFQGEFGRLQDLAG